MTIYNNYDLVYLKGQNEENEDAYVTDNNRGIFSVIDGATGLGGLSGKVAAETIKDAIVSSVGDNHLLDVILAGNAQLGTKILNLLKKPTLNLVEKESRSSCGIAAIKLSGNKLEYVHAGDCMLFIEYENGEIRTVTYDHLAKLDSQSIKLMKEYIDSQLTEGDDPNTWTEEAMAELIKDAKQKALPKIVANRNLLNTQGGYGVIDGSTEVKDFINWGNVSLHDAKRILLLSDGLQLPDSKASGQTAWHKTAEFAFANGLEALKNEVVRLENSDWACFKYPRLKYADDKAGIMVHLK